MTDTRAMTLADLLHLVDRARRGTILPPELDDLHGGITAMAARLDRAERGKRRAEDRARAWSRKAERYREAWFSARRRSDRYRDAASGPSAPERT